MKISMKAGDEIMIVFKQNKTSIGARVKSCPIFFMKGFLK